MRLKQLKDIKTIDSIIQCVRARVCACAHIYKHVQCD